MTLTFKRCRAGNSALTVYYGRELMKRYCLVAATIFVCLMPLAGCAYSKVEGAGGSAIDEIEAISIASAAAEKGGWEVVDVGNPRRVKSGWRVFLFRKEQGKQEESAVVVTISADGKQTKLSYPYVPNVSDELQKSKPPRRPFRL